MEQLDNRLDESVFFLNREKVKDVPDKLQNYIEKKHYLHGTDLLVSSGKNQFFTVKSYASYVVCSQSHTCTCATWAMSINEQKYQS